MLDGINAFSNILGASGGAVVGGIMNMVPLIFRHLRRRQEFKQKIALIKEEHELKLKEIEKGIDNKRNGLVAAKLIATISPPSPTTSSDFAKNDYVYYAISNKKLEILQLLKASVRPVVAYGTFTTFIIGTILAVYDSELSARILNKEFMAWFGLVMGYYFSSRSTEHFNK
jgi:hypothetical protein